MGRSTLVGTRERVCMYCERKTVSREQLLSNSRAWRTNSQRTTSHQQLAQTAQTNLESLPLERLLLHLCILARAHRRKGSLHRLCGERVLLRVIDTLRSIGFGHQIKRRASTQAVSRNTFRQDCRYRLYICMFAQTTHYKRHNVCAL